MSNASSKQNSAQLSIDSLLGLTEKDSLSDLKKISELNATPANDAAADVDLSDVDATNPVDHHAPMLRHYLQLKKQYPDHILLYQVGDFYEIFFEDAKQASDVLGIRLTARHKEQANPVPMCGVPIHAIENYLPKLIQHGFSCVLMSQVDEPINKKIGVRREISRIITPGVRYEGDGLNEKRFNFLASTCIGPRGNGAISYLDVSTGQLRVQCAENFEDLLEIIKKVAPSELILPSSLYSIAVDRNLPWLRSLRRVSKELSAKVVFRPFARVTRDAIEALINQRAITAVDTLAESSLLADLLKLDFEGLSAIEVILGYVDEVSFGHTPKLSDFRVEERASSVFIDAATRRNLELTETRIDQERKHSLLGQIDYSCTAMGSRLLAEWILSPSRNIEEVKARHASVEELFFKQEQLHQIRGLLKGIRDLERLLSRVLSNRATPRDLYALGESTECLVQLEAELKIFESPLMLLLRERFDSLEDIAKKLRSALADEVPNKTNEGGIFRAGFDPEVDRLRGIRTDGKQWLAELEQKEKDRTGISSGLKIRYNNVFGYFIEVTKTHLHKIPEDYQRKQTLANAERFITPALKEYEQSILSAKSKQIELEKILFVELRQWIALHAGRIQLVSRLLSILDVLSAFAYLAREHNYCRPEMYEEQNIEIKNGRHPVVERAIGSHNFVPNDVKLNGGSRRFAVLTGPNMGGKSTYLRQVGLIQLLAQAGSFVPAESAVLGMVDRIFTRIGGSDDLSRGDSTFMVEMREAACIVRKASTKSLVLIDEIGRGTATADGFALATAIAEWLHDRIACRTLFATHFHELTALADTEDGVFCLAVEVIEKDKEIIFTHRIEEKAANRSYGLEVARLAGLPDTLLARAKDIMDRLDSEASIDLCSSENARSIVAQKQVQSEKSSPEKYPEKNPVKYMIPLELRLIVDKITELSPDTMTPLEALLALTELKKMLRVQ